MGNRIKSNFYLIDGYRYQRITKADRAAMSPEELEYWKDKAYWYVFKKLPDHRLYSGWGFSHPTKLTPEDLPDDYILLSNYKKHGYIRTSGVRSVIYKPSSFHNHTFKDDFLFISYSVELGEFVAGFEEKSTFDLCDEYIFGNDIIDFIAAMDKYSPDIDTSLIKKQMVDQYNAYCEEMGKEKKINSFEELL